MTKAGRTVHSPVAADSFSSVLAAEAQARDAIHACQQQYDEAIRQAHAQADRIRTRADSRIHKIQESQAACLKALAQQSSASGPTLASRQEMQRKQRLLQTAVSRLAARLTGESP